MFGHPILRRMWSSVGHAALVFLCAPAVFAQDWLHPVPPFPLEAQGPAIRRPVQDLQPFTVAGECGALVGQQDGSFEAWVYPVKLLSHMQVTARVDGYDVPIAVNEHAAEIEVHPDRTTITYAHIAFTVKQTMFATQCGPQSKDQANAGVMALFTIDSVRPMTLTFSFTPEVKPMWPAPQWGVPSPEWVTLAPHVAGDPLASPGWYMLHLDFPDLAAAVALPDARPGILAPYQERPKTYPLQFVLRYDPAHDRGKVYPLLMAVGRSAQAASQKSLQAELASLNAQVPALYRQTAEHYASFLHDEMAVDTPDAAFNDDIRWAEVSIDQLRVRHREETGLIAGLYSSGDSARPGFGWFFGRDSLYTLYGIDSYGDFALARNELEFLIARQRTDGKMPHEYSQTADEVNWGAFPYEYAAADSTPLFLMAMEDYVRASGDVAFLRAQWPAVEKAWNFERSHDSDGDGIYDNSQGTGWVESWPPGMPHQEVYLAALDQQASGAMARLSRLVSQPQVAQEADTRAAAIAAKIPGEYAQPDGMYAFSYNGAQGVDTTATVYPAVAWWDGHYALPHADAMFRRWASAEFSTDWGLRDLGDHEALYDPISYHQGSVWPLFTGWTAVAEYRTGRTVSAYDHLMQTAGLTTAEDLGAVTELLSGDFFVPFGRSTTHQLWSSAMVLIPAVRGLFGITVDALDHTLTLDPHLPAQWDHASVRNVHVGAALADLEYQRDGEALTIHLTEHSAGAGRLRLASSVAGARVSPDGLDLRLPLPAVEVNVDVDASTALPLPGARTSMLKVLEQDAAPHSLRLLLAAQGGSEQVLALRVNDPRARITAQGGEIVRGALRVRFPAGAGYQQQAVTLGW
jgi:hypothetical protein